MTGSSTAIDFTGGLAAAARSDVALAKVEQTCRDLQAANTELQRQVAQLKRERTITPEQREAAVRALHVPVEIEPSDTICRECSFQLPNGRFFGKVVEFPCPTLVALDGEPR